ncbi:MAG: S41 family peptidase [Bacteroidetes bacterium]|nr:S41 family peptidase [Bacteroidota bacterium]
MKFNYKMPLIIAAVMIVGMVAGFKLKSSFENGGTDPRKKFEEVMRYINRAYVDMPDNDKLSEAAIEAMLKELDPHSTYIPAKEVQQSNEELDGNFEGIGVEFNLLNDTIIVVSPISGGPSEQVGIHAGDKIIKIESKTVAGVHFTNEDVFKNLRGEKGTKVHVSIKRGTTKNLLEFTIKRDKIPIYSVDASFMATPEIGYVKINRFGATTLREFSDAMTSLKKEGMKSLILDLRGNPGGYLKAAIDMADEFLPDNQLIVYTKGRSRSKDIYKADTKGDFEKGKIAVMMDDGSASASEILGGAIQDHDRGVIIGTRSFGKGLVQEPFVLSDGSVIRLTVARYYTPSGRCIQRPYDKGAEDYYGEVNNRLKHGELFNKDSIKNNDSLKFKTDKGRIVYGGGGISPDIFVPVDTSEYSPYLQKIYGKGIFSEFVIEYMDAHRESLKQKYTDVKSYAKNFVIDETIFNNFTAFAETKGIKKEASGIATSSIHIKREMKALIARQLYKNDGFWYILNQSNASYKKAIETLQSDNYTKLGLGE